MNTQQATPPISETASEPQWMAMKADVIQFWGELPPLAQSALIIVLSIIAAKLSDWILTSLAGRWAKKTKNSLDDEFIALMHRPVFLVVLLLGLDLASQKVGLNESLLFTTRSCLQTIAIFIICSFMIRSSRLILDSISRRNDQYQMVQPRTLPLYYNISLLVIIGAAVYFMFIAWEIDPTAWLASAGIIGLALSFAAKDSLANLFAGAFILADSPYKLGDYIILDSGERGRVTNIGLRSTRMLTRDDVEITIPNSVMGNSKITNESGGPYEKERIRVKVGVAYGTNLERVEELLVKIAEGHPEIMTHPEPRVRCRQLGDSSVVFELLAWIEEPVLRGKMTHLLTCEIYNTFLREKIEIPFPQRVVYLKNDRKDSTEVPNPTDSTPL
jgi:small-conductance mechanosensitive channel